MEIPVVDKSKPLVEQLEEIAPYSANILLQEQLGMPTNADKVKNARFVLTQLKAHKVLEKENKKVGLQEKNFNFRLLDSYGTEEQKNKIKDLFKSSFDKIKFIE